MTDETGLTEKINRLKKTITEKQPKEGDSSSIYEHRTFRKQLKRLQRRRRALSVLSQRGKKVRPEKEAKATGKPVEKETKAADKPAEKKAKAAGKTAEKKVEAAPQEKPKEEKAKPENPAT